MKKKAKPRKPKIVESTNAPMLLIKPKKGMPTKYDPSMCKLLLEDAARGMTFNAFCGGVMIAKSTGFDWIKAHAEFELAAELAKSIRERAHLNMGMDGMKGRFKAFNATAWIFMMKNCHQWKDRIEHSGAIGTSPLGDKVQALLKDPRYAEAAAVLAEALASDEPASG